MKRPIVLVERALLATGVLLLGLVAGALGHRFLFSQVALAEFDQAQTALLQEKASVGAAVESEEVVDFRLWSEKRIRAYRDSLLITKDKPLGVISLGRLGVRAPVFEGTGELVLNRGVGWIAGTSRPGDAGAGNIGIAGHRDGFFRAFKDIAVGDVVELATPAAISSYAVDSLEIVHPEDVHVLRPRGVPSLTLVTCYPFYFAGDAPQRFIVHATLKQQVEVQKLQQSGSAAARPANYQTLIQRRMKDD